MPAPGLLSCVATICSPRMPFYLTSNMQRFLFLSLLVLAVMQETAYAQGGKQEAPIYYAVGRPAMIFSQPDSTRPYVALDLLEPVYLLEEMEEWYRVRTENGAEGYVAAGTLSNVWIRVDKRKQMVYLYRGGKLHEKMPADFSNNTFLDKQRRGSQLAPDHWRTPEGYFYVVDKNPASRFYRALILNYPNVEDARHGLRQGTISQAEYEAILRADSMHTRPPMDTALGGLIEIHGDGTGLQTNWTRGCVAVQNNHMNQLWRWARVGTPVLIE